MDYIVYVDSLAGDIERILERKKTMLAAGTSSKDSFFDRLNEGDCLYLIPDSPSGRVELKVTVKKVVRTGKIDRSEARQWLDCYQGQLQVTNRQWKKLERSRSLSFIEIDGVEKITPFPFNRILYGHYNDWIPVKDIEGVKKIVKKEDDGGI